MRKEKVLIAGGSGLIGSRLKTILRENDYEVSILSRRKNASGFMFWNPATEEIDERAKEADHLINLAGAGIADRRWTSVRKKQIINSRVNSTEFLRQVFASKNNLSTYVGASAIGFYGDNDGIEMTEQSDQGKGFMSECCQKWELAHSRLKGIADRHVTLRLGIVLSSLGGAFERMYTPMKFGLCPYFGSGKQYYSWIHIDDICNMIIYALRKRIPSGIYNGVAPSPLSNKAFVKSSLAAAQKRGIVFPVPQLFLKLILGEMAHVVLDSVNVSSEKIEDHGFKYKFPFLEDAVADILKRKI